MEKKTDQTGNQAHPVSRSYEGGLRPLGRCFAELSLLFHTKARIGAVDNGKPFKSAR